MDFIRTILRVLQVFWILLLTALIGNVIATNIRGSQAAINFSMFVIVLSWLAALYGLAACFVTSLAMPIVELALDGLCTLFTFIAAVVLAAKLTAVNCADLSGRPSDFIAFGSGDDTKRCREIQASTAFMWFLFACFIGTLFFAFKAFRSGGGGSVRRGPNMSQVGV